MSSEAAHDAGGSVGLPKAITPTCQGASARMHMWTRAHLQRIRVRQLTWVMGALGVILIGQANEFSYAYLGSGRIFSPLAFVLAVVTLVMGLRVSPRPRFGVAFVLFCIAVLYTLAVGSLLGGVTASLSDITDKGGSLARGLFTLVCASVATQALMRTGALRSVVKVVTAVAAAVIAYQVMSAVLGHQPSIRGESYEGPDFRYSGVFGNPNQAAGFCSLLVCLSPLAGLSRSARLAITILALSGALVTVSRSGFVTIAAVLAVNALLEGRGYRFGYLLIFATVPATVFWGIPAATELGLLSTGESRHLMALHELATGKAEIADNTRGELLFRAADAITSRPFLGYGLVEYGKVLGIGTHNMYTHFGVLAGVPAMIIYACAVGALVASGFRIHGRDAQVFVVSVGVFIGVMGLASHNLLGQKHTMLLLGMACGIAACPPQSRSRLASTGDRGALNRSSPSAALTPPSLHFDSGRHDGARSEQLAVETGPQ